MWNSSHTNTHHTINQIEISQSPPLKSLTFSLGPTLWVVFLSLHEVTELALIPYVTTYEKSLATSALYLKRLVTIEILCSC